MKSADGKMHQTDGRYIVSCLLFYWLLTLKPVQDGRYNSFLTPASLDSPIYNSVKPKLEPITIWQIFQFFRKTVLRIYLFEIKRVRRITLFWGNDLATVLIAVFCFTLRIDNSYLTKIIQFLILSQHYQIKFCTFVIFRQKRHI